MLKKAGIVLLIFCCAIGVFARKKSPVNLIFDSDMGPDYDDVVAITILHNPGRQRRSEHTGQPWPAPNTMAFTGVLSVFNTYYKRPDVAVGVAKKLCTLPLRDWQHWTDTLLAKYPHQNKNQ